MKFFALFFLSLIGTGLTRPVSAADASIAGKWHFVIDSEGGTREVEPVFELHGNKVTGKWNNDDVQGTFADGKLDLNFIVNSEEGGRGTLGIKGTFTKYTLTGTWSFQSYEGKFRATRVS